MKPLQSFFSGRARKGRSLLWPKLSFTLALLLLLSALLPALDKAGVAHAGSEGQTRLMELRVDTVKRGRVMYGGFQLMSGLGDFFEFYEQGLTRGRKRIFSGPWRGVLRENSPGSYSLSGRDHASGAEYNIIFRHKDASSIELLMTFKAPSMPSNLEFDLLKLSADLFKGGALESSPASIIDPKAVPVEPRSFAARMLLTGKNRITVRGVLCDAEIEEASGAKSMYAADGRNVPWNKSRGIIVGARHSNLQPGSSYSFRYLIKSLPPSQAEAGQNSNVLSSQAGDFNAWSFFNLPAKKQSPGSGSYLLRDTDKIYGAVLGTAETVLAKEVALLTSLRLEVKPQMAATARSGIIIDRVSRKSRPDILAEGFEMAVSADKAVIRCVDERGCLYGAYALLARLTRTSGAWGIELGVLKDWPDLAVRGGCLELLPPAIRDVDLMKRYLDALSRARSNTVIFLHSPQQARSWMKRADDGGWTKEQMIEVTRYARFLHMDVWAGMTSQFNPAHFPEMEFRQGANFYDPFKEKNYQFMFSLYEEILKTYQPSTLLIAHDEIQGLTAYAAAYGKTTAEVLVMDTNRIHDWLKRRGVRTAIWGDMLLEHGRWEAKVGSANSENPFFRSGATHHALEDMPKDVLILDWHYEKRDGYDSVEHFRRNGFGVLGTVWHEPDAARNMAESVKRSGGQGIISTDWGLWRTMSPAATTLYAPLCGWSVSCKVSGKDSDVTALAATVRDPAYAKSPLKQVPVRLDERANKQAVAAGDNKGLFGAGPVLDPLALKPGKQLLGGILFDIIPDSDGGRNNYAVLSNKGSHLTGESKAITIFKGDAPARRVAFVHTAFIEEPAMRVRNLGRYIVEYDDGRLETIDLLENWNITDIRSSVGLRHNDWTFLRSPDILIGSRTAWQGNSGSGVPLNLQLFVWNNPRPVKKIRSISLVAGDDPKGTKLALLGLTFLQE